MTLDAPSPGQAELVAAMTTTGPLTRAVALALLDRGADLIEQGEFLAAGQAYQRVAGFDDAAITGAAWLGLGEALYRLDREDEARGAWEAVLRLPDTPSTYVAWRNLAAAHVRAGDLQDAIRAYREADRRAPADDRGEIASRLGWLAKETGDSGAARRYFARSRGSGPAFPVAYLILGLTVIVSFYGLSDGGIGLAQALALDKHALAAGQLYRLVSPTLIHANIAHLLLNMYALYLVGPVVERMWGSVTFVGFYLLTAAAASTASFLTSPTDSVGASGAIFGLIGILLAGTRVHNPVLDRQARAIVPQLGTIVVINLAFGFFLGGTIDNAAHLGGLISGLWLGLVVPPGRTRLLRDLWHRPADGGGGARPLLVATGGILALVSAIAVGLLAGGVVL